MSTITARKTSRACAHIREDLGKLRKPRVRMCRVREAIRLDFLVKV